MSNTIALEALKKIVASWDARTFEREKYVPPDPAEGDLGAVGYWTPSSSMVDAEAIANARAAIAALEAQPQPSAQGPKEIFLQLHGDCLPHETDLPVVYTDDSVTWCWHRINDSDVRYIRADLAANPKD